MSQMPSSPQDPYTTAGAQPGSLLDRFLARLIDGILLAVVNGIIVSAIIVGALMGQDVGFYAGQSYAASAVSALLTTAIVLGYFAFLESSRGQTIGKMVMKLHTRGPHGGNPTMEEALRRNAWIGLGFLGVIPVIGVLASVAQLVVVIMIAVQINGDPARRQGWHDQFAGGTTVVKQA